MNEKSSPTQAQQSNCTQCESEVVGEQAKRIDLIPAKKVVHFFMIHSMVGVRASEAEDNRILQLSFWESKQWKESAGVASGEGGQVSLDNNGGKPPSHLYVAVGLARQVNFPPVLLLRLRRRLLIPP